jgi:hypothetical protein
MRTTLVSIPTPTQPLDGAFHEPEGRTPAGAYLRGDQEPARIYPAEDFKARTAGECTVEIVADCGHFYVGREDAVAATVASWLARTLGLAAPPAT